MLREIWGTFVRKHVVAEVPDELAVCFDCNAEQCLNGDYETCPARLARAAVLSAGVLQPVGAADTGG
jgi:hypothetical protein